MNTTLNDICTRAIKGEYKFILISGNGGAGKSTFAHKLQYELQHKNKTIEIISTDDFMLDKAQRKNTIKTYLGKDGKLKKAYLASTFPEAYDFISLMNSVDSQKSDIVIIEGIGAALFLDNFKNSYKIFLQVDTQTEYKRRIQRGRPGADLSPERMEIRAEQFELFILPLADKFDLQLTSGDNFAYTIQSSKNTSDLNLSAAFKRLHDSLKPSSHTR